MQAGLIFRLLILLLATTSACFAADDQVIDFRMPEGFSIEVLVDGVPNARSMVLGDRGTLFVATRRAGKIYAVRDVFSDTPQVITIAEKLDIPNGVAFRAGDLYVAETQRILRYRDIESRLESPGEPEVFVDDLPYNGKLHSWRYIAFGPDEHLYVSLGAPCNVCDEPDLSVILRIDPDGSSREVFARGIRNSVGFDWHPDTEEMWFSDNGRDMLGDDIPPCELNRITEANQDFGFPYCHGVDIVDPKFGDLGNCADSTPPVQALDPHSAPLGVRFYTGGMFPSEYQNQIFIAEHGSWNRSKKAGKTGYRLVLVRLKGGDPVSYEPFLEGFVLNDEVLGRPVDILIAPDGAMLLSDDQRGVIYRISYGTDT